MHTFFVPGFAYLKTSKQNPSTPPNNLYPYPPPPYILHLRTGILSLSDLFKY
jgi:hypothetical protein